MDKVGFGWVVSGFLLGLITGFLLTASIAESVIKEQVAIKCSGGSNE